MKAKISSLEKTILADLQNDWTIEKLAQILSVSPAHLQKLFKDETGISPIQFVKHRRLEKARELLEITFLRVQQIGFEVGLTDQTYFNREFKKKYGLPPNHYRERYHEKTEVKEEKSQ